MQAINKGSRLLQNPRPKHKLSLWVSHFIRAEGMKIKKKYLTRGLYYIEYYVVFLERGGGGLNPSKMSLFAGYALNDYQNAKYKPLDLTAAQTL